MVGLVARDGVAGRVGEGDDVGARVGDGAGLGGDAGGGGGFEKGERGTDEVGSSEGGVELGIGPAAAGGRVGEAGAQLAAKVGTGRHGGGSIG